MAREVYLLRERTWSEGKGRQAALYFQRASVALPQLLLQRKNKDK